MSPRSSLRRCTLLVASAAFALSCVEVKPPKSQDPEPRDIVVKGDASLVMACTPTGVETCFDARDDNCNGIIDEGCGLETGVLQFVIAWDEPEADVDLNVYDASGELARVGEPTIGGLMKDRDCPEPEGTCFDQNYENVFLTDGEPARGRYRVVIRLDQLGEAEAPVRVRLGARVGQQSYGMQVELSPGLETEEKSLEFTL